MAPVRFTPGVETPEPDEQQTIAEMIEVLLGISRTTYEDAALALRSVHAKSHGILSGELIVEEGLPPELRQGLFAEPGRYPVVLRFSTNPGDILPDSISLPRGLAIKVMGVPGERLSGSPGDTQDFVMVNGPAFLAPNARKFLSSLKLLAKTTDQPVILKQLLASVLRGAEATLEAVGSESAALKSLGGHPYTHILGETFHSQAALRYGEYIAKVSLAPASPSLRALTDAKIDTSGRPDALREEVTSYFAGHAAEWSFRVQLCTDLETMPVEDASVIWSEEASPPRHVARLVVQPQPGWTEERARLVDDGFSFSPWHGLAAHQPLGSIMRARRDTYRASAEFRGTRGRCPLHEPPVTRELPS